MSHTRLLLTYGAVMTGVSTVLGGYVACGAQTYRVPVHGTESDTTELPENVGTSSRMQNIPQAQLLGVHSTSGWAKSGPIHFYVSEEMPSMVVEQLEMAMETWESAVGKDLFVYMGVESRRGSDFTDLYEPLDDDVNGHYLDWSWAQSTGKSASVLATTIWENDPEDPAAIVKADIRYNAQHYIFGDALTEFGSGRRTIVDMESLALHELGHLLGLSHVSPEDDRYSVMNPSLFIGEGMMTRRLSFGDIERIRSVYGVGDESMASGLEIADDFESPTGYNE